MPQACQCLRRIWTMRLILCFNFWSSLKVVRQLDKMNGSVGRDLQQSILSRSCDGQSYLLLLEPNRRIKTTICILQEC